MMRFFIDTEFYERPCQIDLISIGLVAEDGRELYLESSEFDEKALGPWLQENVVPHLGPAADRIPRKEIADLILEFVGKTTPEFWGYYADYDWVAFCWLFGRMVDLPPNFPMYCRDLKQCMDERGIERSQLPPKPKNAHNALADARWLAQAYNSHLFQTRK